MMMMNSRRRTAARLLTTTATSRSKVRRRTSTTATAAATAATAATAAPLNGGGGGGDGDGSLLRLAAKTGEANSVAGRCSRQTVRRIRIQPSSSSSSSLQAIQNYRLSRSSAHAIGLSKSSIDGQRQAAESTATRISENKSSWLSLDAASTSASSTATAAATATALRNVSLPIPSISCVSSSLFASRLYQQRQPLLSLQYYSTSSILRSLQRQQQQKWTPQQLQQPQQQRRWMSDNPSVGGGGGGGTGGGGDKTSTTANNKTIDATTQHSQQLTSKNETDPLLKMTDGGTTKTTTTTPLSFDAKQQLDRALNTATQITTRQIQRVGHALNVGDQLAVYGIILLVVTLLAAPVVIQAMKNSKRKDYFTGGGDPFTADPVDDFAQLARNEWDKAKRKNNQLAKKRSGAASDDGSTSEASDNNNDDDDDDDEEYQHSTMEKMLKDVIGSKALQQAAQQFVVTILESDDFKMALKKLVQELWNDLLQDPETLAQVIHVLQVAIKTPQVQRAVQELVVDLVAEPQVKQALISMLQQLGAECEVLQATQSLLTNATHQSLADPEILEHSMEFATDVLGDDIVQQSAGEALRNSVGHAIGHSLYFNPNTILTVIGVGFFLVGMIALGNVSTTSTVTTAMVTNALGGRGGGGTENSSSSRSVVAATAAASAATATTPILQQVWDMISTAMATIVHTLIVSPICYLGRGMVQAVSCTVQAAYQHIVVPPFAATASILHQVWQWTGQELVSMFVTPSNAILSRLVKVVHESRVDISRYSNRMWDDLNNVVASTVDTAWTALYTTVVTCFQWIVSQSSRVIRQGPNIILTGAGAERAWSNNTTTVVLDQSRHFMTLSMQYLSQTSMRVARFFQEWFLLAVS